MKIANQYNHLNGLEYLLVHKQRQWQEIQDAIAAIDANNFVKQSKDKTRVGHLLYDQVKINKEFERILSLTDWHELRVPYCVTDDIETAKAIADIRERDEQRRIIEEKGHNVFNTYNQVDFVKDRIAVEVQFGKYFSVAYDLHVKHTFFFLRDDIDVGIEIIPTHKMNRKMDTGVSWFENEVANVIREGRSNPTVPIVIIGIEPEEILI